MIFDGRKGKRVKEMMKRNFKGKRNREKKRS